jgi:mannose-6-phosphate isomerase-like protein (cupin superfamily)
MIKKYFKDGEKLDVAGLNEITVLLDRSETESTEIGWNCWTPQQDGPPHKHNDKDQVFYVTGGVGIIKLGNVEYPAGEGSLAYVPAGLVHQSITTTEEKLCYMLFNVFNTENKEGHGTFAEHIEKVKEIRRKQADTGITEVDEEIQLTDIKDHKYFPSLNLSEISEPGTNKESVLLDKSETNKCELTLISVSEGTQDYSDAASGKELSVFVLYGNGTITAGKEELAIGAGDLIYLPRGTAYSTKSSGGELKYLCLKSFIE